MAAAATPARSNCRARRSAPCLVRTKNSVRAGLLAISAKAPLQVSESSAADLQRVDAGDFPDWAGSPDNAMALAYRYVRPGYKLALVVRRYDEAEVLQALVDSAQFTSVVADDGQMMTEMSLSIKNNGRQFLEIELPPSAKVWSAFVAGQPVRPFGEITGAQDVRVARGGERRVVQPEHLPLVA